MGLVCIGVRRVVGGVFRWVLLVSLMCMLCAGVIAVGELLFIVLVGRCCAAYLFGVGVLVGVLLVGSSLGGVAVLL